MTDEELVPLGRQGDSDAFDQLVLRHQGAVYRAVFAALRAPEDSEEVTQDSFVRAWQSLGQFRGDSSFRTWVLTIAWRRALSRRRSVLRWRSQWVNIETVAPLRSANRTDEMAIVGELREHAIRAIEALSPRLRDAFLLAQSGEYDYVEIAVMLNIPVGTVKWRVFEARRKVRERLALVGYVDA